MQQSLDRISYKISLQDRSLILKLNGKYELGSLGFDFLELI